MDIVFLFLAAIFAGAINAIAGGGGLLVFPALLLTGVAPLSANASSAAGIWMGMVANAVAYRHELLPVAKHLLPVTLSSLGGGALGAWLLLHFSDDGFAVVVPYLVALGTFLFAIAPKLASLSGPFEGPFEEPFEGPFEGSKNNKALPSTRFNHPALILGQGLISIYGGFFGGGAGILMLTLLNLTSPRKLLTLQAVKVWMAVCINAAALIYFITANILSWPHVLLVAVGTSLGGYSSVHLATRVPALWVRRLVIVIGSALSIYFFAVNSR